MQKSQMREMQRNAPNLSDFMEISLYIVEKFAASLGKQKSLSNIST